MEVTLREILIISLRSLFEFEPDDEIINNSFTATDQGTFCYNIPSRDCTCIQPVLVLQSKYLNMSPRRNEMWHKVEEFNIGLAIPRNNFRSHPRHFPILGTPQTLGNKTSLYPRKATAWEIPQEVEQTCSLHCRSIILNVTRTTGNNTGNVATTLRNEPIHQVHFWMCFPFFEILL